jgi:hydroxymethylpyrimidine/phosphomethylpyrimidine kinase
MPATQLTVKADGRRAADLLAIMLSSYLGERLSLNSAIVEAEKFVRAALCETVQITETETTTDGRLIRATKLS